MIQITTHLTDERFLMDVENYLNDRGKIYYDPWDVVYGMEEAFDYKLGDLSDYLYFEVEKLMNDSNDAILENHREWVSGASMHDPDGDNTEYYLRG